MAKAKAKAETAAETEPVVVDLNKQAREILKRAAARGVEHSFMFVTAFTRYKELIAHLAELQKAIKKEGTMVTKEYVKGRANLYVNPAVAAYNQTAGAADKTAQLLLRYIVTPLSDGGDEGGDSFDLF